MTKYLISFPSSAMDHIPAEEFPAVVDSAHAVVHEAKRAGVWVFGGRTITHAFHIELPDGGQESQCGWLKDKFGISWQAYNAA
jgi:predicted 3-demethylubiquinone-9 3-methyltransferase (glyoxalase superfamily)